MTLSVMNDTPAAAEARLSYGPHPSQFVDFRRAALVGGARPLVVMIHGGFWRARRDLTYAGHLCVALGREGFATANIEYRRVGEEGGGWPGTLEDAAQAVRFARERAGEFHADAARTLVMGHSAGGHLALWISSEIPDVAGAISLAGASDLHRSYDLNLGEGAAAEFMGGAPDELPERYAVADPALRPARTPRVLIHGDADDIVPVEVSRGFPEPRRLVEIPGADHHALIDPASAAWSEVVSEIRRLI